MGNPEQVPASQLKNVEVRGWPGPPTAARGGEGAGARAPALSAFTGMGVWGRRVGLILLQDTDHAGCLLGEECGLEREPWARSRGSTQKSAGEPLLVLPAAHPTKSHHVASAQRRAAALGRASYKQHQTRNNLCRLPCSPAPRGHLLVSDGPRDSVVPSGYSGAKNIA